MSSSTTPAGTGSDPGLVGSRSTPPRAAVAASNPLATQAGLEVVTSGGNAVDAALAAMMVVTVSEPGIVAPLGGAFITIWPADGDPVVIDGNVAMPGRGGDQGLLRTGMIECLTDYAGGIRILAGPGSVAVPGMVPAFGLAHAQHGRAPWREIIAPAARAARGGFPLGRTAASYLDLVSHHIFAWDPGTRAVYTDDASPLAAGSLIQDDDLADCLDALADEGPALFTSGAVGRALVEDMRERGGLITQEDLDSYEPIARPALRTTLGPWDLAGNPPPSIGGPVLTAMLRLVSDLPATLRPGPAELALIQQRVLGLRAARLDRAPDLEAAGRELLRSMAELGADAVPTSPSTAHVSVVDAQGNACAVTASAGYGSGMRIAGTGLLAGNALGEPELNRLGLHALPPGTRLASNMAPMTARSEDGAVLAIGSPGADRITTALLQVLVRACLLDETLHEAIEAPRLHVRLPDPTPDTTPDEAASGATVEVEDVDGLADLLEGPDGPGLPVTRHAPLSMYFGGVGAALRRPDGDLIAAADPRRAAATAVG